jgi:hypothetical protein
MLTGNWVFKYRGGSGRCHSEDGISSKIRVEGNGRPARGICEA